MRFKQKIKERISNIDFNNRFVGWIILFIISSLIGLFELNNITWWIILIASFLFATLFAFLPEILLFTMSVIFLIITLPTRLIDGIKRQKKSITTNDKNYETENLEKSDRYE